MVAPRIQPFGDFEEPNSRNPAENSKESKKSTKKRSLSSQRRFFEIHLFELLPKILIHFSDLYDKSLMFLAVFFRIIDFSVEFGLPDEQGE